MTEIKTLYDKIYSSNQSKDSKVFIDIYESNKDLIENADYSISNPDFEGILRIVSDYALALSSYGSTSKALPYLDKAIQLFKDSSPNELTGSPIYEALIWTRGFNNFNIKKIKLATLDFDFLVENYPDNDKYRSWLLASKTVKFKKITHNLWYLLIVIVIWYIVIKADDVKLKNGLLIGIIVISFIAILTEIAIGYIKRSVKRK